MKTLLLFIILVMNVFNVLGQELDSLEKEELQRYLALARKFDSKRNLEQALIYGDSLYNRSKELNYVKGILDACLFKGLAYQKNRKGDLGFKQYVEALQIIDRTKFDDDKILSRLYRSLAAFYYDKGNIDSAMIYANKTMAIPCVKGTLMDKLNMVMLLTMKRDWKAAILYCEKALECAKSLKSKPKMVIRFVQRIAILYGELGDHEMATQYIDTCLYMANEMNDSVAILNSYNQLGRMHARLEHNRIALSWFQKAVNIVEQIQPPSTYNIRFFQIKSNTYKHLAEIYSNLEVLDSSIFFIEKALEESYRIDDDYSAINQLGIFANILIKAGKYQVAIDSLQQVFRMTSQHKSRTDWEFEIYSTIGRAYLGLSNWDKAEEYFEKAQEIAKKWNVDRFYWYSYKQLEELYIKKKNYEKAYKYRLLRYEYKEKMRTEENENAILRFEIKYESEKLKRENLELEKNQEIQEQEIAFNKALNQRNQYIIIGLIVLMILLGSIGFLVYRQRGLQAQFKEIQLEQKALKAQINPHFFFNVLNSLQGTILSEEPMVAYKYHTKFTKLMRLILVQSEKEGIKLEEEVEALRLYLELEQLRTGNSFEFEIINEINLTDEIVVPSMLLQPFVENAIWHGVMNRGKDEDKKITIRVEKKNNGIVCEIQDTGVGRKEAQRIKEQKTNKHESMGMKVTQDRLELFQLRYNMPLNFSIEDRVSSEGSALGTAVKLEIPIINS